MGRARGLDLDGVGWHGLYNTYGRSEVTMDTANSQINPNAQSYAGFWPRALAFVLDYLVISAYLVITVAAGASIQASMPGVREALFSNPITGEISGFFIITLPVTLYFAFFEASMMQATWGKQRLKLQVVGPDQGRISIWRSLARSLLKFVPWELAHAMIWQISFAENPESPVYTAGLTLVWVLVGANIASMIFSPTRQTIYDRLAGTRVMRILPSAEG
jgi:uncharacterized RDD family membrane protein YckC